MMRLKTLKVAKTGCLVASALLIALGILIILWPDVSVSLVGIIAGVMLIALGLFKVMGYFSKDLYRLAFQYDLAFGLLLMVLGTLLLVRPDSAMYIVCLIVGISIAGDGLLKLQTGLEARKFGLTSWWLIVVLGVLAAVVGIITAFRPVEGAEVLMILMGVSLLAEGLLNLCVTLCAVKIVKGKAPYIIEEEHEEIF